MLAEHLDKLNENGVSLDLALSGGLVISKQRVVECLDLIGQDSLSKVLSDKQGNNILLINNPSLMVNLIKHMLA